MKNIKTIDGRLLHVQQEPYFDMLFGDGEPRMVAMAHAVLDNKDCMVIWEIINKNADDEDQMCDWYDYWVTN